MIQKGDKIGTYSITGELGHGGMGGVIDLRLEEINHRPGYRAHILALPPDSDSFELSARAEEEIRKSGWRFPVFSRFFCDCEQFRLKAKIRQAKGN